MSDPPVPKGEAIADDDLEPDEVDEDDAITPIDNDILEQVDPPEEEGDADAVNKGEEGE